MKKRHPAKARPAPRPWVTLAIAAGALALWLVPMLARGVEQWYSRGVYPIWQRMATLISNFVPFALFDLLIVAAGAGVVLLVIRARRARAWRPAALRFLMAAALAAIWFQLAWGLNYRRMPLAETLAFAEPPRAGSGRGSAPARPDEGAAALARFGGAVAAEAAATATDLDRDTPMSPSRMIAELSAGFDRAQQQLGFSKGARPGRPKYSLFNPYFRWAAIDGVTNPFVPETVIVSGLTPAEAYATVAHEWAHLAGHASEDEAHFVGWLTCLDAGGGARYNAWLFALTKAAEAAPRAQAQAWIARAGPLAARDLAAIRERLLASSPAVRRAASSAYDKFLRANRVEGGIASYDGVLALMLKAAPWGRLALKPAPEGN